jgi:hypothetical protein
LKVVLSQDLAATNKSSVGGGMQQIHRPLAEGQNALFTDDTFLAVYMDGEGSAPTQSKEYS